MKELSDQHLALMTRATAARGLLRQVILKLEGEPREVVAKAVDLLSAGLKCRPHRPRAIAEKGRAK